MKKTLNILAVLSLMLTAQMIAFPSTGFIKKAEAQTTLNKEESLAKLLQAINHNASQQEIEQLLQQGTAINNEDTKSGWTPLMFAVASGNKNTINLLLQHGADVNKKGKDGITALMIAGGKIYPEITTLLLQKGAKVNVRDRFGMTALMYACGGNSNPEVVDILLENKADAKMRNNTGKTALEFAKRNPLLFESPIYNKLEQYTLR